MNAKEAVESRIRAALEVACANVCRSCRIHVETFIALGGSDLTPLIRDCCVADVVRIGEAVQEEFARGWPT